MSYFLSFWSWSITYFSFPVLVVGFFWSCHGFLVYSTNSLPLILPSIFYNATSLHMVMRYLCLHFLLFWPTLITFFPPLDLLDPSNCLITAHCTYFDFPRYLYYGCFTLISWEYIHSVYIYRHCVYRMRVVACSGLPCHPLFIGRFGIS